MKPQTTHTPGPWRIEKTTFGKTLYVAGPKGGCIANFPGDFSIREADARLIAAGPDLLAALKGMLDQPETNAAYDTMMQRAQAAINRAEGETP